MVLLQRLAMAAAAGQEPRVSPRRRAMMFMISNLGTPSVAHWVELQ